MEQRCDGQIGYENNFCLQCITAPQKRFQVCGVQFTVPATQDLQNNKKTGSQNTTACRRYQCQVLRPQITESSAYCKY